MTRRAITALGLTAVVLGACGSARTSTEAQAVTTCESCHGYPPGSTLVSGDLSQPGTLDVTGPLRPTDVTHLVHAGKRLAADGKTVVDSGLQIRSIGCLECHANVRQRSDPGHIVDESGKPNAPPAVVRFDDPAALAGRTQAGGTRAGAPAYDAATHTCSNVYCHGAGIPGATAGVKPSITWTASAGQSGCGSCHGIPPATHPASVQSATQCAECHLGAIDASGFPNPATHVNGQVELVGQNQNACSACHGDRTASGVPPGDPRSAPPTDARGNAGSPAVGVHQAHVRGGTLGAAVACGGCHPVPSEVLSPGHADGTVNLVFGPLGNASLSGASYDRATQTCSNVYCHGAFQGGKGANAPRWSYPAPADSAAAVACGTCHDLPPPAPAHPGTGTTDCGQCHPGFGVDSVAPALHINGRIDRQ